MKFRAILFGLLLAAPLFAQPKSKASEDVAQFPLHNPAYTDARETDTWCMTDVMWRQSLENEGKDGKRRACATLGSCDVPSTRDATTVDNNVIDVIVHVMRTNSGSGGVSQATVDATMAEMNSDFAGTGFSFNLVATRYHNDSTYSCIRAYSPFNSNWFNDIQNMKATYAETPTDNINVFMSCQTSSAFGTLLGIATFPWDSNVLQSTGGLWLNTNSVGSGGKTASHEMGHCLGLWHTHHGVSEVSSCGSCYEYASGFEGDVRGDFCSDTPPTPTNYNCSAPGGSDCQGTSWGATQPQNFMGYGPDSCLTTFTAQQTRRMQCWSKSVLSGWFGGGGGTNLPPNASFTAGTTNLTVNVDASGSSDPDGTIVSYAWNFGDGSTGSGVTASHTYASAGTYTVTLTVTDDDGATDSSNQSVTVSSGGGGTFTTIIASDFESGWQGWTDGGGDCRRSANDSAYASQGTYCVRIRDNSGTRSSFFRTGVNLTSYTEVQIEFDFIGISMENGEDFFVEFYDGSSWNIVAAGTFGSSGTLSNNTFYTGTITVDSATYNFSSNSGFRFRCDASGNGDRVYIDLIDIAAR